MIFLKDEAVLVLFGFRITRSESHTLGKLRPRWLEELEPEQIQPHMTQKPVLRGKVDARLSQVDGERITTNQNQKLLVLGFPASC